MVNGGLTRLYDAVESIVPGVAHPVVQMVMWDAIEEFCVRSTFWRETMEWVMPIGNREVDLNPVGSGAIVANVLDVRGLTSFSVYPPALLTDSGSTDQPRSGFAYVSCKPTRLGNAIPSFLVDDWYEGIKDGAMGRLYQQPGKPYSSPQLAEIHLKRFRTQMRLARDQAERFNSRGPAQWSFPLFAKGHRRQ